MEGASDVGVPSRSFQPRRGANMHHRFNRLFRGSLLVAACLAGSWVVARAVPSRSLAVQFQTQRDAAIAALGDAIERGSDFIGPLPGYWLDDDSDVKEDDALMRGLWQRLENGPAS